MNIIRHILIFFLLSLLVVGLTGCNTLVIDEAEGYMGDVNIILDNDEYKEYKFHTELLFNTNGTYEQIIEKSYKNKKDVDKHHFRLVRGKFDLIIYNSIDDKNKYIWAKEEIDLDDIDYIYELIDDNNLCYDVLISDNKAIIKETILDKEVIFTLDYYPIPKLTHNIFSINSIYIRKNFNINDSMTNITNCFIYIYDHNKLHTHSALLGDSNYSFNVNNNNLILDNNYSLSLYNNNKNIRVISNNLTEEYELYKGHFTLEYFRLFNI